MTDGTPADLRWDRHLTFHAFEDELDGGWVAECPEVSGAMAQGENEQEALGELREVVTTIVLASLDPRRSPGAEAISAERARQIDVEGWTPEHDAQHDDGSLLKAAGSYLYAAQWDHERYSLPTWQEASWPWKPETWKPSNDPARNLVKAGALIAAELDRLAS